MFSLEQSSFHHRDFGGGRIKSNFTRCSSSVETVLSQDFSLAIEQIINRPQLARSRWGIKIKTLTGESLKLFNELTVQVVQQSRS